MSMPQRDMPADFREYALTHKAGETRARYKIGYTTYARFCAECGISGQIAGRQKIGAVPRSIPNDFAIHAQNETNIQLSCRYGCSDGLITKWRHQTGITRPAVRQSPDVPSDFLAICATRFLCDVATHYQTSRYTVRRWASLTGARFKKQTHGRNPMASLAGSVPAADASLAGRAQQHLQKWFPVYKASILDRKREGYIVDRKHMATEEMISLARDRGFKPDAWMEIGS